MSFQYHGPLAPDSPLYQQRIGRLIDGNERIQDLSQHLVSACLTASKSTAKKYFTIYASRQAGKTTLLLNIEQRIKAAGGYACWIDFQWAYGAAPEPAINFMAQQIIAAIPELEASVKVPEKFHNDGFGFDNWLKRLPIPERKPFVILIEELGALPLDSRTRLGLLLRAAFNGRFNTPWKHVVLIFFGGVELHDMTKEDVSPLFNVCENIDLLDLGATDTQSLITCGFDASSDSVSPQLNELSRSIYAQTSGHPYLTQFLGEQALIHSQNKGALPVDIQTLLPELHVDDLKYLHYLYKSIQKYGLLEITKILLYTGDHPDEDAIRRLILLGVLRQQLESSTIFRNQLIRVFLEKSIFFSQPQAANIKDPDPAKVEEETRLIRETRIQGLLEKLLGLPCIQTPESRRNILTQCGVTIETNLDLNGSPTEAIPRLFYFLENLPRLPNGCYPLGMFLISVKAWSQGEIEITRRIDEFVAQYGLLDSKSAIFVSYAWGGESERTVNELELAFAKRGLNIVRDKKDLSYKGSIQEFERRIGQGQCIILVISDKYLHSEHCMYELVEIAEHQEIRKRIFPIVLEDAHIYKPVGRLEYIKYWDSEIDQLDAAIKGVGRLTNLSGFTANLDKYGRIRARFDDLTSLLSDMNTLTPERLADNGFETLISAIRAAQA